MQFIELGNRAQKTPPKASRDQLLHASSAGKKETQFLERKTGWKIHWELRMYT